jgi:hypothetical protein
LSNRIEKVANWNFEKIATFIEEYGEQPLMDALKAKVKQGNDKIANTWKNIIEKLDIKTIVL